VFKFCSITTDLWTAKHQNKGYISLKAHFVDADWVMQTRCLETREMPMVHNAENLAEECDQEMKEWNIRSKVVAATTDNIQSVINAVEKPELLNLPCVGHTLQLVVKHAFDVPSVSRVLACIKRLVLHFRKSPKATYKLHDKQTLLGLKKESLKNEFVTRWSSTYKMLRSSSSVSTTSNLCCLPGQ